VSKGLKWTGLALAALVAVTAFVVFWPKAENNYGNQGKGGGSWPVVHLRGFELEDDDSE
jgi:hypothetical protein